MQLTIDTDGMELTNNNVGNIFSRGYQSVIHYWTVPLSLSNCRYAGKNSLRHLVLGKKENTENNMVYILIGKAFFYCHFCLFESMFFFYISCICSLGSQIEGLNNLRMKLISHFFTVMLKKLVLFQNEIPSPKKRDDPVYRRRKILKKKKIVSSII